MKTQALQMRLQEISSCAVFFLFLMSIGSSALAVEPVVYADRLTLSQVTALYPKSWKANVEANWPKVREGLREQGMADDRAVVLYALATIRVETIAFTPASERPSRYSKKADTPGFLGTSGETLERDFGAYDSTIRFKKNGKVIINKGLGNCFYRGKDEDLMRSMHGDPPLPPCDDGQKYRGRGFIQITGKSNYLRMQKYLEQGGLDIDLENQPELAGNADTAAKILAAFLLPAKKRIDANLAAKNYLAARKIVNSAGLDVETFKAVLVRADQLGL